GPTTDPRPARGVPPERLDQLPRAAPVARTEQAAGDRPAPEDARLLRASRLERPDPLQPPGDGRTLERVDVHLIRARLGIDRDPDLLPRPPAVRRAVQLRAEVAVFKGRVEGPIARVGQRHRHVVPLERDLADLPAIPRRLDREQ